MLTQVQGQVNFSLQAIVAFQAAHLVEAALVTIVAAALVRGIIVKVHRVGTASMVAGVQACCLVSRVYAEATNQLEDIPKDEHVHQHPGCNAPQYLASGPGIIASMQSPASMVPRLQHCHESSM